jgi:hypothetical protein
MTTMTQDTRRLKAVLLFTAALAFAAAPFLTPGFGGFDPAAFPVPQADPPVQPAGYAFGIWGLIYLWLLAHAGFGLFARADDPQWDAPRWPLFASLALGASWLAVANAEPVLATVQIWAMLLLAVAAALRTSPAAGPWLHAAPVALYAGWLTAAAWVAFGFLLGGYGLLGGNWAAAVSIAGATGSAVAVQRRLGRAPLYGAAVIWAFAAVAVANAGERLPLALAAVAAAVVVLGATLRAGRQGRTEVAS